MTAFVLCCLLPWVMQSRPRLKSQWNHWASRLAYLILYPEVVVLRNELGLQNDMKPTFLHLPSARSILLPIEAICSPAFPLLYSLQKEKNSTSAPLIPLSPCLQLLHAVVFQVTLKRIWAAVLMAEQSELEVRKMGGGLHTTQVLPPPRHMLHAFNRYNITAVRISARRKMVLVLYVNWTVTLLQAL